jgi:hypothetical protein
MSQESSYLDLRVGPFALALRAELVRAVHQDATGSLCDLASLFGAPERAVVPFAIVTEARGAELRLGVDRVGHLRGVTGRAVPVPPLGLFAPELFEGAVRHGPDILLVIAPAAVAALWDK